MKIYYNANIYIPGQPQKTAFAVDHGTFIALGSDQEILDTFPQVESAVNLQNMTVWPGLTDSHVHLQTLADSMAIVDCETPTIDNCLERVKEAAEQLPPGAWIRGHGWNHNRWENGFGSADLLDSVTGDHPAYLTAKSLHAAWANSKALALAGIGNQTSDPPSGIIQRDQDGNPTGILFESGAMAKLESAIPKPGQKEIISNIKNLIPKLWQMGLIGVHDFDGLDCWKALQTLYQNQERLIRVRKSVPFKDIDTFINASLRTDYGDDWLQVGSVKLFADGALGPQTAAMNKPYLNSENTGTLLLSEDEIVDIGKYAVAHGLALAIHAIGDRANEVVLNAFSKLRTYEADNKLPHYKHRIEHVQIIDDKDLQRMKDLDITASIQAIHAPSDMDMADRYLGERSRNAYAYRSMINHGIMILCGSDAPVEPINPFYGIHAAVTRRNLNGLPDPNGWHPEQRLTLEQAIKGFTQNPAVNASRGGHLGKIESGYKADFLVLDQDPQKIDPELLASIKPLATFIEGICVFKDDRLDMDL
jgi:predicted amidohydrolase YtcJ